MQSTVMKSMVREKVCVALFESKTTGRRTHMYFMDVLENISPGVV